MSTLLTTVTQTSHMKYTVEEKASFKEAQREIRAELASLVAQVVKIKKDRFTAIPRGGRPGLFELRGRISALLETYLCFKGGAWKDKSWWNDHTRSSYMQWCPVYNKRWLPPAPTVTPVATA